MSREITVVNSSLNKKQTVGSEVETWGELKTELSSKDLLRGDVRGVVKETSTSLDLENAQLPADDFTLFIIPKKSKAGSEDYASWSFAQLRAECASRDDVHGDRGNYGSTEEMISKLRESDERSNIDYPDTESNALEAVITRLEAVADRLEGVSAPPASEESEEEPEEGITNEDLDFVKQIEDQL